MTIRKFIAAVAIAGTATALASGVAFADEAQSGVTVAAGTTACVELPSSPKPVHAEGLAQSGLRFTLEVVPDGSAAPVLVAQSADDAVNFFADANSYLDPTAFPGAVRECAVNVSGQDQFVVLHLTSPDDEIAGTPAVVTGTANGNVAVLGSDDPIDPSDPPAAPVVVAGTVSVPDFSAIVNAAVASAEQQVDAALAQVDA